MSNPSGAIVLSISVMLAGAGVAPAFAQSCARGEFCEQQAQPDPKKEEHVKRRLPFSFVQYWVIDALWMPTENGSHTVGLIGGHLAIAQIGRVYMYGPPGLIVLRADTERGRAFQTAYTWGFSVFPTDFTLTGTKRRASLFVNFAKAWTSGDYRTGQNMAGVSLSFQLRKQ
jgi:hypothetical protein